MKNVKTAVLVLVSILGVSGLGAPLSASQTRSVPFRGWVQARETSEVTPPILNIDGSGSGLSTHLGPFQFRFDATVDLATGSGPVTAVFIAVNGDRVFAEGNGQATSVGERASVIETFTVTGGTGRFQGVSGQVTMIRLVTLATGESVGAFDGRLTK